MLLPSNFEYCKIGNHIISCQFHERIISSQHFLCLEFDSIICWKCAASNSNIGNSWKMWFISAFLWFLFSLFFRWVYKRNLICFSVKIKIFWRNYFLKKIFEMISRLCLSLIIGFVSTTTIRRSVLCALFTVTKVRKNVKRYFTNFPLSFQKKWL